jgi:hypothetical protein
MTTPEKQQDVDLWEIWIEYDPSSPGFFGTLYILGEISVNDKNPLGSLLMRTETTEGKVLRLQAPVFKPGRQKIKEVFYAEPVRQLDQYAAVHIFSGNEMIAKLDEIEVLI